MTEVNSLIPIGHIEERILLIRGEKVILDVDLAAFYDVSTKVFNQAVKRNSHRFPDDFRFQLTQKERSEVVTNCDHLTALKFSPYCPYAFTEHGTIMAASVLNSHRAIEVSIFIVRAFIKLRKTVAEHRELARKLDELEHKLSAHDQQILTIVKTIKQMASPAPLPKKRRIGFNTGETP
ncbi:MAG TPA: ORF6N domain-containing protein [Candidatus Hydrogenedentes bacterium]|nr:ORF6N domain-containing protein [Candidatus Hydrogenedentota bacterium]